MKSASSVLVLIVALASASAQAQWNFANDFSQVNNPSGQWSYGWSSTLGGNFVQFEDHALPTDLYGWDDSSAGQDPSLMVFQTTAGNPDGIMMGATDVALHPGPGGQYCVVRWLTPTDGFYRLDFKFDLVDSVTGGFEPDTDVHILENGTSLWDVNLVGYGDATAGGVVLNLQKGDLLDFAVGYGPSKSYYNDSTRLAVDIDAVPEPGTFVILTAGCVGILVRRSRSRVTRSEERQSHQVV